MSKNEVKKIKELFFHCPECGYHELSSIESAEVETKIRTLNEDGDFNYKNAAQELEINYDEVVRFECTDCGFVLKNEFDGIITDNEEVVKWVKKHCDWENK